MFKYVVSTKDFGTFESVPLPVPPEGIKVASDLFINEQPMWFCMRTSRYETVVFPPEVLRSSAIRIVECVPDPDWKGYS